MSARTGSVNQKVLPFPRFALKTLSSMCALPLARRKRGPSPGGNADVCATVFVPNFSKTCLYLVARYTFDVVHY